MGLRISQAGTKTLQSSHVLAQQAGCIYDPSVRRAPLTQQQSLVAPDPHNIEPVHTVRHPPVIHRGCARDRLASLAAGDGIFVA